MSWWKPFKRKSAPPSSNSEPEDQRHMSDDWKAGDLAECINAGFISVPGMVHPKLGDVLRVSAVDEGPDSVLGIQIIALRFEGRGNCGWDNRNFRKLRPTTEPAEQEFTVWLKDKLREPAPAEPN
ncbi:MAG: hypothetical protein E6R03_15540 [Hyphomicrobiaceae bacterium]|nr:MAG: hypothetical protein E6R03_15540 [Hyphomicrobiaceae bacterium]